MVKELIEKRKRLHEENVALLKRAKDDGRDVLNADEETEWQQRDAAIEALSAQIARYQKQEEIERRLAEAEERKTKPAEPAAEPRTSARAIRDLQRSQQDLDLAVRGWFLKDGAREEHLEAARRVGLNVNAKELTFHLPSKAPRTGAEARAIEVRAQGTATGGAGGFTVPDEMMRALEEAQLWFGSMRQVATVFRTDSGADLPIPQVNDTAQKGEILGQNTTVNQQDVTFTQLVLKSFKYSSKMILVSVELLQDSGINVPEYLGRALGTRIARIHNEHFTTGAGTTLPWGIVTRATQGLAPTGSVAGGFTYAHLVDMEHSVDIAYRRMGAAWMMNDVVVSRFKKLLDSSGRPIWQPYFESGMNAQVAGGSPGAPGTLLGYPVFVNNDMSTATTNGTRAVLFGALQSYLIRDVREITLLRLDERFADAHQVAFLAFSRNDGDLNNAGTNPVKYLQYTT